MPDNRVHMIKVHSSIWRPKMQLKKVSHMAEVNSVQTGR